MVNPHLPAGGWRLGAVLFLGTLLPAQAISVDGEVHLSGLLRAGQVREVVSAAGHWSGRPPLAMWVESTLTEVRMPERAGEVPGSWRFRTTQYLNLHAGGLAALPGRIGGVEEFDFDDLLGTWSMPKEGGARWAAHGRKSHGKPWATPVPDGGGTLLLLAGLFLVFVALDARLRRRPSL